MLKNGCITLEILQLCLSKDYLPASTHSSPSLQCDYYCITHDGRSIIPKDFTKNIIQSALVICGILKCSFAYFCCWLNWDLNQCQNYVFLPHSASSLFEVSLFAVLWRITRETCTSSYTELKKCESNNFQQYRSYGWVWQKPNLKLGVRKSAKKVQKKCHDYLNGRIVLLKRNRHLLS